MDTMQNLAYRDDTDQTLLLDRHPSERITSSLSVNQHRGVD